MKLFEHALPATLENVSFLRRTLRRELIGLKLQGDLINDLQLSIAELATNTITHAKTPPATLGLRVDLVAASLRIELSDDGSPFTEFAAAWEAASRKNLVATDTSGLGLALTHAILRDVVYTEGVNGEPNRLVGWRPLQRLRPSILIVDDDPTLLHLYASFLKASYRVQTATTIEVALEIVGSSTIDLILADFHLGNDVGTTLLSLLERDAQRLPIPVIMLSSDRNLKTRKSADGFGIEFFLLKPVSPKLLRSTVDQALTRSRLRLTGLFRYFGANIERLASQPPEPTLNRVGVASRSTTATAGGGDFILHLTKNGQDRFVLVDVMGHGFKAKAGAIALAAILRAVHALLPAGTTPGQFLSAVSNIARDDAAVSELIATLAVVDRHSEGVFDVSSAAHPAPVVVGGTGLRMLDNVGPLIGIVDDAVYPVERIELGPNERLVLVTDGIEPKYLSGGGRLPAGLEDNLVATRNVTLEEAANQAASWIHAQLGPSPRDDWTIMLIERHQQAA